MYPALNEVDRRMMRRALSLARQGEGRTSPNPPVGCVIVRDGRIVGEGWHRKAGTPHAEVHALVQAGEQARGADVYVTLEPCAHQGKTPPCALALIEARVRRVFAGTIDPNPKVCGRGMALLQEAGIDVQTGILERECRQLIEPFIRHTLTGKPFVTLKCAMTLDGKIATQTGDSVWITNEKSRRYVHKLRAKTDAVMVGRGTVVADDPRLTCRVAGGRDPLRVVVDSALTISPAARLLHLDSSAATLIATLSTEDDRIAALQRPGVEVLNCVEREGRIDLEALLRTLGRRGVQSLLVEGGGVLAGELLRLQLVDKVMLFYAPKLVGGDAPGPFAGRGAERMDEALVLKETMVRRFGTDLLVTAYPEYRCLPD
jgi:diaminohydroxyphosphoribosylaminopyrimidine deaminase/5-amino-6-(5-phosphoribosylamino)uracil reductase